MVHVLLKPGMENFKHYFASMWKWKWKSLSRVQLFVTPWTSWSRESPGQNTELGSLSLFQGIFPTQGSNPGLLHCRQILYQLSPTMRETWVRSLGREDLLEKEMAAHSSILAWKIPWMEESSRLQSMGSQRVRHNWDMSLASVWVECNCAVVWAFFGIALLWDWKENQPFPDPWPLLSFSSLLTYWVQLFHSIIF